MFLHRSSNKPDFVRLICQMFVIFITKNSEHARRISGNIRHKYQETSSWIRSHFWKKVGHVRTNHRFDIHSAFSPNQRETIERELKNVSNSWSVRAQCRKICIVVVNSTSAKLVRFLYHTIQYASRAFHTPIPVRFLLKINVIPCRSFN